MPTTNTRRYHVRLSDGTRVRYDQFADAETHEIEAWVRDVEQALRSIRGQRQWRTKNADWRRKIAAAEFAYTHSLAMLLAELSGRSEEQAQRLLLWAVRSWLTSHSPISPPLSEWEEGAGGERGS